MSGGIQGGGQQPQDRDILLRILAGDRGAFGVLVQRYMRRAYYGALTLLGNHDDALDISQEAFAKAFVARFEIDPERNFYTWYYQILRRLCLNVHRDRRVQGTLLRERSDWLVPAADEQVEVSPEHYWHHHARQAAVRDAISALPLAEREIIALRELQGMSYADIAMSLSIPRGTVMSRLYAARQRLAASLAHVKQAE